MAKKALLAWQDLELGAALREPGSAENLKTGDWRSLAPHLDASKCIKCQLCMIYCPEFCISEREDGYFRPNMDYCKGCGICANVCPKSCIAMALEVKK
jgi:pyruvate ferredoxin oxidoreductase delta subunit